MHINHIICIIVSSKSSSVSLKEGLGAVLFSRKMKRTSSKDSSLGVRNALYFASMLLFARGNAGSVKMFAACEFDS